MAEEVVTTFTPRAKEPSPRPRACTADDPPVAQPLVPPLHMPDPQETVSPPQFQETSEAQMVRIVSFNRNDLLPTISPRLSRPAIMVQTEALLSILNRNFGCSIREAKIRFYCLEVIS